MFQDLINEAEKARDKIDMSIPRAKGKQIPEKGFEKPNVFRRGSNTHSSRTIEAVNELKKVRSKGRVKEEIVAQVEVVEEEYMPESVKNGSHAKLDARKDPTILTEMPQPRTQDLNVGL